MITTRGREFEAAMAHPWRAAAGLGKTSQRSRREDSRMPRKEDAMTEAADHSGLAARRVRVGMGVGAVAAALAVVAGASWSVAALCFSDAAALVFAVWVGLNVGGADAAGTARLARAEDASRAAAEAVLIGAGVASLIAVVFTFAQAGHEHEPQRGLLAGLAITSIGLPGPRSTPSMSC